MNQFLFAPVSLSGINLNTCRFGDNFSKYVNNLFQIKFSGNTEQPGLLSICTGGKKWWHFSWLIVHAVSQNSHSRDNSEVTTVTESSWINFCIRSSGRTAFSTKGIWRCFSCSFSCWSTRSGVVFRLTSYSGMKHNQLKY